jgi:hypothetical protein
MGFLVIRVSKTYDNVPIILYVSVATVSLMMPIALLFCSIKLKDMFHLIKENEDLSRTIREILEMFPKSVIIQSLDPVSKQIVTKFANHSSKNHGFVKFSNDLESVSSFDIGFYWDVFKLILVSLWLKSFLDLPVPQKLN